MLNDLSRPDILLSRTYIDVDMEAGSNVEAKELQRTEVGKASATLPLFEQSRMDNGNFM